MPTRCTGGAISYRWAGGPPIEFQIHLHTDDEGQFATKVVQITLRDAEGDQIVDGCAGTYDIAPIVREALVRGRHHQVLLRRLLCCGGYCTAATTVPWLLLYCGWYCTAAGTVR